MFVRMLTTAAGPRGTFLRGTIAGVDDETALAWIAGGYASVVGDIPASAEDMPAASAEPETAMVEMPKGRHRKKVVE